MSRQPLQQGQRSDQAGRASETTESHSRGDGEGGGPVWERPVCGCGENTAGTGLSQGMAD